MKKSLLMLVSLISLSLSSALVVPSLSAQSAAGQSPVVVAAPNVTSAQLAEVFSARLSGTLDLKDISAKVYADKEARLITYMLKAPVDSSYTVITEQPVNKKLSQVPKNWHVAFDDRMVTPIMTIFEVPTNPTLSAYACADLVTKAEITHRLCVMADSAMNQGGSSYNSRVSLNLSQYEHIFFGE